MSLMRRAALWGALCLASGCMKSAAAMKVENAVKALPAAEAELLVLTDERVLVRDGVTFPIGEANIEAKCFPALNAVVTVMNKTDVKLLVEGHTDNTGGPEANQSLSLARAAAVKKYLEEKGVAGDRLNIVGYGPEKPIAPNDTDAGRAKNRRVEFKVRR